MFWILFALAGWIFAGIGWYRMREIRYLRAKIELWREIIEAKARRIREWEQKWDEYWPRFKDAEKKLAAIERMGWARILEATAKEGEYETQDDIQRVFKRIYHTMGIGQRGWRRGV